MGEHYGITLNNLCKLMQHDGRDGIDEINKLGGIDEVCKKLGTSQKDGLRTPVVEHRRATFGSNVIVQKRKLTFLNLLWNAVWDKILIILLLECIFMMNLNISIVTFACVVIVVLVTALFDYFHEQHYQRIVDSETVECNVVVIRNAVATNVPVQDLVVGDICVINVVSVLVPADGILIENDDLQIDESSLNGHSGYKIKSVHSDLMVLSGTKVVQGSGTMVVIAVGVNTRKGRISSLLEIPKSRNADSDTIDKQQNNGAVDHPIIFDDQISTLQQKVRRLFLQIIYTSLIIAVLGFAILMAQFLVAVLIIERKEWRNSYLNNLFKMFFVSLNDFFVGATAEGIVLSVVIALAVSIKKLFKNNILIRRLHDGATMGSVTSIVFDKTGTLTTNRMDVMQLYICEQMWNSTQSFTDLLPSNIIRLLAENISVNSSSSSIVTYEKDEIVKIGNGTECALLEFVRKLGFDFQMIRNSFPEEQFTRVFGFNSDRKLMGTVIPTADGNHRLFVKGASEIVLSKCKFILGRDGKLTEMSSDLRENLLKNIVKLMASTGLRTITMAYRDFATNENAENESYPIAENLSYSYSGEPNWNDEASVVSNLTCLCVFGISGAVCSDVSSTIQSLQTSGITVRMATGDDIDTATSIALKCGIFVENEDIALDGKEFNRRIRDGNGVIQQYLFDEVFPTLRVLARASPMDKYILVKGIVDSNVNKQREVVCMVGDGDNDALALRKADISFSMNQSGSVVAKNSSKIILMDDKVGGIVNVVLWGRNAYVSIRQSVQFFLTVKIVCTAVVFCDIILKNDLGCNVAFRLFLINIFLNVSALLQIFLTCNPTKDLLLTMPHGRTEHLISKTVLKNIFGQSLYQLVIIILLPFIIELYSYNIPYNSFFLMTLFNMFNARKIHGEPLFLHVLGVQFDIWIFCHGLKPMDYPMWLWCFLFGIGTLVWQQLLSSFCKETKPKVTYSAV